MLCGLQIMPVKAMSQSRILLLQNYFGVGIMDEKFIFCLEEILEKLEIAHSTSWEKYLVKVAFQSRLFLFFVDIWSRLFKKNHPLRFVLNSFLALYECSPAYAKNQLCSTQKNSFLFVLMMMFVLYFISLPASLIMVGFIYLFFLISQIVK